MALHWLPIGIICGVISGCATYSSSFRPLEREITANRPDLALKLLEKQNPSGNDRLLYFLNKAMLLRMQGNYRESNQNFELAKKFIEEKSPKSVTQETAAFIINDSTRAFVGAPFEQVLVHLYSALNYIQLGEIDAARVEAQQVDVKLKLLAQDDDNPILIADPFARYLTGIIYEDLGEWSNALIAYRKAYESYKAHQKHYPLGIPRYLKEDLLRLTEFEGLRNERDRYKKEFNIKTWPKHKDRKAQGEIILIVHNGLAPIKREHGVGYASPGGRLIRISLPYYEKRRNGFATARLRVAEKTATSTEVKDINQIAERTLQAYMPAITARAVARIVAKQQVADEAGDKNPWAGLIVNIASFATEVADTRSWLTLPGEIHLARMPITPGTYNISIELLNHTDHILYTREFKDVKVKPGAKTYLSQHWVSPFSIRSK